MLSEYLKGFIDALCYPIYRGARDAGCVQVPADQVHRAVERIQKSGCFAVIGKETDTGEVVVWAVRNESVKRRLTELLALGPDEKERYHLEVGKLLGYSEQHIRIFLETEHPTV